jgi:hypothetical protein
MILIRRDTGNTSHPDSTEPTTGVPKQAGVDQPARPGGVDAGAIARKPRSVATALQNLHGI